VLHLNCDASGCLYIRAMDFSARRCVRDFSTIFREKGFPLAMPGGFVLPPRIAIPSASMRSVMDHAWTAFSDHYPIAEWTSTVSSGERFATLVLNYGILQIGVLERVSLSLTSKSWGT
jgi:hypothetical protein